MALNRQIHDRINAARRETDRTFALCRPDALYRRAVTERHRLIFYVGHLEAFDWNLLGAGDLGLPPIDAGLDRLFAFGIDPVDGNLPADSASDWPALAAVEAYRAAARAAMDERIDAFDAVKLEAALEHRLMHAETLAYLLYALPLAEKLPPRDVLVAGGTADAPPAVQRTVDAPPGRATLGRRRGAGFGWDNEFEEHAVDVPAFTIDALPVTNGAYLRHVVEGAAERPAFWRRSGDRFLLRTMFGERPLPLDAPAWVTHDEATAYARREGARLPTEAEWHRAAFGTPGGAERAHPWGEGPPAAAHGNFGMRLFDPEPVTAHPAGESAFGLADLVGNGWEWTSTPFAPLPGFERFPFYPGYSADFFDGRHFVLKGAGPRTDPSLLRRSFRNWFQPRYPHVQAKFRCVRAGGESR